MVQKQANSDEKTPQMDGTGITDAGIYSKTRRVVGGTQWVNKCLWTEMDSQSFRLGPLIWSERAEGRLTV